MDSGSTRFAVGESDRPDSPVGHQPRRPAWRRLAGRLRAAVLRLATPLEQVIVRPREDGLLPPAHLRRYYYNSWSREVFRRACEATRVEVITQGLKPEDDVLEIGSGIGNLALGLTNYLTGSYSGLEIHREAVRWCETAITPRYPSFRFYAAEVYSAAYNPRGTVPAERYAFPFRDSSFDFVFLGSVFTHMLPPGIERYVAEIARVLRPGGLCVASYFLLSSESFEGIRNRTAFMSFDVECMHGLYRLHDATKPEAAVAIDEAAMVEVCVRSGLRIRSIRRGEWFNGGRDNQDVLTCEKAVH